MTVGQLETNGKCLVEELGNSRCHFRIRWAGVCLVVGAALRARSNSGAWLTFSEQADTALHACGFELAATAVSRGTSGRANVRGISRRLRFASRRAKSAALTRARVLYIAG